MFRVGLRPTYKYFLYVSAWAYSHPTNLFYVSPRGLKPTLQIFFMCLCVGLRPPYKSFLCVSTWGYAQPTNLFLYVFTWAYARSTNLFYVYPRGVMPTLQIFFICLR